MGQDPEQLRRQIEQTRQELSYDVDALTDKVSPGRVVGRRVERTKSALGSVRERVMGSVPSPGGSASGAREAVTSGVSSAATSVSDTASSATDTVIRRTEGNPLAAGLISFGVGWLVSSLLPASQKEQQAAARLTETAREQAGPVQAELRQVATDLKDNLQQPAQQAVESVKSTAQEAARTVQEEGRTAAAGVKEDAQQAGQTVREEAKSGGPSRA